MKKLLPFTPALIWLMSNIICANAFAFDNLFYTLRYNSPAAAEGLAKVSHAVDQNAGRIQILASQAYHISVDGSVQNSFNPQLSELAKRHHIKFMALVSNPAQPALTHQFLQASSAQKQAIQTLVQACVDNQLYGLQVDFENVVLSDKSALTDFYQNLAKALHKKNFAISIAITPRISEDAGESAYQLARYMNWTGAFDYKALGKSSDFVTLMAYDQHEGATTPGPISSLPWSEAVIKHALKYIPAQKISLGIPTYSGFWQTARSGHGVSAHGQQIEYSRMQQLLAKAHQNLRWDNAEKVDYTFYEYNELNEYIFAEDARSFAAKYSLAKKYHLRGVSVWRLGSEDPGIWGVL